MKDNFSGIDDIIVSYLTGEINNEDRAILEEWLLRSGENSTYFRNKKELWASSMTVGERVTFNADRGFSKFLRKLVISGKTPARRVGRWPSIACYSAAACAAVIAFFAVLHYTAGPDPVVDLLVSEVVIEAPAGSRSNVFLPDGTVVWLNSGSRITYESDFGETSRQVVLEGEACFEVVHNEDVPFCVNAGELKVVDLGTVFNVRNYSDDGSAAVALLEGKVEFSLRDSDIVRMSPGEIAVMDKNSGETVVTKGHPENIVSWRDGIYVFEDESLESIVRTLERGFNVKIEINGEQLSSVTFNAVFDNECHSVDDILTALSATGRINYSGKDGVYRIF